MPRPPVTEARAKLQVFMPVAMMELLDARCNAAGRLSRQEVIRAVWPQIMAAIERHYELQDIPPAPAVRPYGRPPLTT